MREPEWNVPTATAPRKQREDLLSVADLGSDSIGALLELAAAFEEVSGRPIPRVPALRGRTVVLAFFEPSTRTRLSFETAAKRLSADTLSFTVSGSSLTKGESIRDTSETLDAMGVDAIVVRHASPGVPATMARFVSASVVNAGDGWHEHPTQALLDCYTLCKELSLDRSGSRPLEGARIGIVGDVCHSRVARSCTWAFAALGAQVSIIAPPTLMPPSTAGWPAAFSTDLDEVIERLDVVYLLRLQSERMSESLLPSLREYSRLYGIDSAKAARLSPDAVVMHPGPMNRGVEISAEVADSPRSLVRDQVRNGVAVRMAVLFHLLGRGESPVGMPPADEELPVPPLEGSSRGSERVPGVASGR